VENTLTMKAVGKVSARSQTTPHKQIMKRARRATGTKRKNPPVSQASNLEENVTGTTPIPNELLQSLQSQQQPQQPQQQPQQPQPKRRKRRKIVYDNNLQDLIKKSDEDEDISSDSTLGGDETAHPGALRGAGSASSSDEGRGSVDYQIETSSDKAKKDAFKCPFCDHKSGRPNNLVIHINSKHFEESPPRTCSQDPAECIGESILYFLSTKKEFEEKLLTLESQAQLSNKALLEVLTVLTPEQKETLRKRAESQQNVFLANLLGPPDLGL